MIVRYIGKEDTLAFDRDKTYIVMSVERGFYRIMTELDEAYLFPPDVVEVVDRKRSYDTEIKDC